MSTASCSRTIKFNSKSGTYTAMIMSPNGDIYQEYEGTEKDCTGVFPDFEKILNKVDKPLMLFVCTSSRVAEGIADPADVRMFFNGVELTFSGNVSTGAYDGFFEKVNPSDTYPYYGLRILKNIVRLAEFRPCTIKMIGKLTYGTQEDDIQASYAIPINRATGNAYRVTIAAGDNKGFVITEKGGSCKLKAMTYLGNGEVKNGLTYKWQKMGATAWEDVPLTTQQIITVNETDVNVYGDYRVIVSLNGEEIGSDIQGVMDASDPYEVDPNPSPRDETIDEDVNGNGKVMYTPVVYKRGTPNQTLATKFFFIVRDAVGNILNVDEKTPLASYTVTREHCLQAGGDVSVIITSEK